MSTNITTAYKSGDGIILQPTVVSTTNNAGTSIAVTLPRVTRILAVHAFGYPCPIDQISVIANQYNRARG